MLFVRSRQRTRRTEQGDTPMFDEITHEAAENAPAQATSPRELHHTSDRADRL